MHSHSLWRGAVTSSSDQSTVGFQRTPTKISLQINWGQAGHAAGSGAASAREKYISLGRGYLFVELHAASRSISNYRIGDGVCA